MHEALDEIYKMPLHKFRPGAILGAASPYYWARLIEARVSRSFDEMVTIDLVETTLTIRLQTCEDVAP